MYGVVYWAYTGAGQVDVSEVGVVFDQASQRAGVEFAAARQGQTLQSVAVLPKQLKATSHNHVRTCTSFRWPINIHSKNGK